MQALAEHVPPPHNLGRVLVVDENGAARAAVSNVLSCDDADVTGVGDPAAALHHVESGAFNLVFLGVGEDFDLLRRIRDRSDLPVIVITESRDEIDRILGLEMGADEYLIRPFHPRELLARARAILRRQGAGWPLRQQSSVRGGYRFEGWELRRKTRSLYNPDGVIVPVTQSEYAILLAFVTSEGRILSRKELTRATGTPAIYDRSIDVQILRLRRKLEAAALSPRLIQTSRGLGYRFDAAVEPFF